MFKLRKEVSELFNQQEKIMSAIENLQVAVTSLQSELVAVQTFISNLSSPVVPVNNDTAIQEATDKITSIVATLNSIVTPVTVVPAPVVDPAV